jgi:DNA-directed RNA polymerase alpha subunit
MIKFTEPWRYNTIAREEKIMMNQRNIDTMNAIVTKMADGKSLSQALKHVYSKRNVVIPYDEELFNVSLKDLGMTTRTVNALMRGKLRTINDAVEFCTRGSILNLNTCGKMSATELFETILDYCWEHMSEQERINFLIDTVERNEAYIRSTVA